MGEAYTALGDDLGALFFNPAGIGSITGPSFQFSNVNMNEDFQINYAAGAVPFNDGVGVAAGFINFMTTEPEEITTIYQPEGTNNYFDSYSSVVGGAVAYNISDRFMAGISLKWVHEDIWDITSNGFSMDVGALYHTQFMDRDIRVGMSIQNLGTNPQFDGDRLYVEVDPKEIVDNDGNIVTVPRPVRQSRNGSYTTNSNGLPTTLRIGMSYRPYEMEKGYINVSTDFLQPRNLDIVLAVGGEVHYELGKGYAVDGRFGWKFQSDEEDVTDENGVMLSEAPFTRGMSVGGGFSHDFSTFVLRVDYTLLDKGFLDNWHFLTLGVMF